MSLSHLLVAVIGFCRRFALAVVVGGVALTGGAFYLASARLGISTNTDQLFADSLPWRQREIAFDAAFPQFRDLLVVVVDSDIPEAAEETAAGLARRILRDKKHFKAAQQPDALPFFTNNAFLFLDPKPLAALLDGTVDAQPFLGQLAADPSARGLFAALSLLGTGVIRGQADLTNFAGPLEAFHVALRAAADGHARPLSWEQLLGGALVEQAGRFRFVLAQPILDYADLEPGGAATEALRVAAASLPFVQAGLAKVRVTGGLALADEEFATVAQGAAVGTIGSAALVVLWLLLAVQSWRLIVPIVATLVLGLALTTAFAALAVGTLNLISVAFAILFVGIAVDFAIQFCVRYRAARHATGRHAMALEAVARGVGPQIMVAAFGAAAGFLAFVPTDFRGVAELGLIAGMGMVIAFITTITFLPALLTLLRPMVETAEIGWQLAGGFERGLVAWRRPVLAGFFGLAVLGAGLLGHIHFDSDPLHTKNAHTEAMVALRDLMDSPLTNPYSADILAPTRAAADVIAEKLRKLPDVAEVITLSSFVPEAQADKLALIQDAASLLAATLAPHAPAAPVTAADLRMAAAAALAELEPARAKLPAGHVLGKLVDDLRALAAAPDTVLLEANAALTRFLPLQLDRLRRALAVKKVTEADLPAELTVDWRLPDGRVRVQALAGPSARGSDGLRRFADAVTAIAPDAGGSAITITATADTILAAFRAAALGAVVAIAILLLLVLRRLVDVGLVMMALVMSGLLTVVLVVSLGIPLNFANIIALPLLQGVGVSFNIYFVMNWRAGGRQFLGTATARAILFSALTTATAFSSLALSAHPGTASMGVLLLLSLLCTLVVTLVFVPALLARAR